MDIHLHNHHLPTSLQTTHTASIQANHENKEDKTENTLHIAKKEQAEQQKIQELRTRDREVRAHEQAHKAAAGQLAKGAPSYTYQRGPDEQLYAVSGEIQIDTSAVVGNPQATLEKAAQIQRAALAPTHPSSQDRAVAAQATRMAIEARAEIAEHKQTDLKAQTKTTTEQQSNEIKTVCALCNGEHSTDTHMLTTVFNSQLNIHNRN